MMELKRVVVTGLGAITPLGNSTEAYWNGLIQGISGAAPITRFDSTHFKTTFACEVKGFDPLLFMEKKEVKRYDLFAQFALGIAEEAVQHAQLLDAALPKNRIGVIWSSGVGGIGSFQEEVLNYAKGGMIPRFSPFFIPKMILDLAAGHISIKYGFSGLNYSVVSACASASHALIDAQNYIRLGRADIIVCGASEAAVNEVGIGGFNALKALSERNDSPETASRPFDLHRDGFVMGEGGGAIVLESLEHAKARGATIYAELIGGGFSADAFHMTAPHPDGAGAVAVMEDALRDANIAPHDIDYINVHGTSTPLGDVSEIKAIQQVFGEHAPKINISSTKSMTGHLLGAAGIIEAIACIKAIETGIVPPTINHFTDDLQLDNSLNYTFNTAQRRNVNVALSNNFGFGGHNASVIFKKWAD